MSKNQQITKNIKLSEKLAEYIANNPNQVKRFPVNVSYVTFSSRDEKLNSVNEQLIKSLKSEGKKVIKAQETVDNDTPWKFTPLFS